MTLGKPGRISVSYGKLILLRKARWYYVKGPEIYPLLYLVGRAKAVGETWCPLPNSLAPCHVQLYRWFLHKKPTRKQCSLWNSSVHECNKKHPKLLMPLHSGPTATSMCSSTQLYLEQCPQSLWLNGPAVGGKRKWLAWVDPRTLAWPSSKPQPGSGTLLRGWGPLIQSMLQWSKW